MAPQDEVPAARSGSQSPAPAPAPARSLPVRRARRFRRALKLLGFSVLGLAALYLLAANLFLNLWFGALFAGTNSIDVKLGRAFTLWPGDVQVRDVRVVFQDHNLQWTLDLARADVEVKFLPLLRQEFHATRVVGEGTVFRMRHRVDPSSVNEPAVAALPQFPEFPGPAVFEARVPEPPVTDESYDLWTVHLENVDVRLREFWVQQFRYVGEGRARGAFRLRPARQLWVGPATLDLEPGRLTAGAHRVTPALSGHIECTVHPFDVRAASGRDVFRHFTVALQLTGRDVELSALRLFRPDDPTELRALGGDLRIAARTARGVVTDGSRIELEQRGLVLEHPAVAADAERAKLVLRALGARGRAELELDGAELRLGASRAPLPVESVRASAGISSVDLTADPRTTELSLDELRSVVPELDKLAPALAARGIRGLSGSASWSARGSFKDALFEGEVRAALERVRVQAGDSEIELDGQARVSALRASLDTRSGELSGKLEATRLRVENQGRSSFEAGGLQLEAVAGATNGSGRGSLRATVSALRANAGKWRFQTHAELTGALRDWDVERGTSRSSVRGNLRNFVATLPEANLRVRAETVALRSLTTTGRKPSDRAEQPAELAFDATLSGVELEQGPEGKAGALTGSAESLDVKSRLVSRPDGSLDASLRSSARGLQATYGEMRFAGAPDLAVEIDGFDQTRRQGRLRGELGVERFTAAAPGGDADCPWSRVERARVRASAELRGEHAPQVALDALVEGARLIWGDFTTKFSSANLKAALDGTGLEDPGRVQINLDVRDPELVSGGSAKSGWDARSPALVLAATLARTPGRLSGNLRVGAADVRTRLGQTSFRTRVETVLDEASFDYERGHLQGAGTMRLRELALQLEDQRIENWWADVSLDSVDLWAKETLEGGARFTAKLRDGLPALSVLASEGELPGFVPDVFPLRDLRARGSVRRRCQLTDFRVNEVSGGPFVANGRLQSVPEAVRGAFLVRLSALDFVDAGIRFDREDSAVSLFAGDDWLSARSASFDRYASAAETEICTPPPTPQQCGE